MSLFKKLKRIFKSAEPAADRVVAALKRTELGDMVIDSINAVASEELTGAQKFEVVVSETAPRVLRYVQSGGIPALEADVMDLTRALVQSAYLELRSVGFNKIVGALVKLLGV